MYAIYQILNTTLLKGKIQFENHIQCLKNNLEYIGVNKQNLGVKYL